MALTGLSSTNFDEVILGEGIVLIDCWARWCTACKDFAPVFEAAAARFERHRFVTLDTQAEPELTEKLGVSHIPTLILFRDGILLLRQPGYVPPEGLDEILDKAESLDMDHVRAEMEKEAASKLSDDRGRPRSTTA
ncbi:MAG: thioredoxin family protein [Thermoanaerobaculales bacterium]|jgi:thioredoxin 1|nr:thioredoxin family protein [Thermoanaerobaculales bacterium]